MPIYEYECTNCENHLEILQKITDEPIVKCSQCNKNTLIKKISKTSFALKGSGWYVTDFKNSDSKKSVQNNVYNSQNKVADVPASSAGSASVNKKDTNDK